MMKRSYLVISVALCLSMIPLKSKTALVSESPSTIKVLKAFLVLTRESWGCLRGQEIKGDVTSLITGDRAPGVRWQEIKNPDDRQDRLELYLYFPAAPVSGLPGYLVLRIGGSGPDSQKPGAALLKNAALTRGPQGPVFKLQGQVQGDLDADLLYARDFHLHQGLFACPEADLFEPQNLDFLKTYIVKTGLEAGKARASGVERGIILPLSASLLRETREVAAAAELLDRLEEKFKVPGKFTFLWDKARITSQALEGLASSWQQGKGLKSHIALILRDRQGTLEIRRAPTPFAPRLRQKISLQDAQSRISGAEIWIGIDPGR